MRRLRSLLTVTVLFGLGACVDDTTGPLQQSGEWLQISIVEPQSVSAEETAALGDAFDAVDQYSVVIVDALTLEAIADTVIGITPGGTVHALDVNVPDNAFGRTVTIDLIAFSGEIELYRSTQTLVLGGEDLGPVALALEIRYTGPGVRGVIVDEGDNPVAGVRVDLLDNGETSVASTTTEADGSYLFVDLPVGQSYLVLPEVQTGFICPAVREVTIEAATEAVIANFRVEADPCGIELLILSGGDFDDTGDVAALLGGVPDLTVSTFFYLNHLPTQDLLNQHDVILLFSNGLFDESLALGDAIRDYVEIGGNVVTASFYWQNRQDSGLGSTGWGSLEQVDAMTSTGGANYSAGTLGTVVPHPLTTGLSTLTASTFWGGAAVRTGDGAVVAATWADSSPLVAYRVLPGGQRMVGVSLFPGVADAATGDVDALFRNAVTWAGKAGGPAQD
jgi:hypothetical protein